jgi:MOSC domain-containing protein YiiM
VRLQSLNVGLPREIDWRGQKVHTAIWKHPVEGRRRVRRLNIDGDGQADLEGHGGEQRAVFVYQLESYRHWEAELGRDDFVYGVRRELHRSGACGRRGLRRGSLPHRERCSRSHSRA